MSTLVTILGTDLPTNSRADINGNFAALNSEKIETSVLDTDTTLSANSDAKVATQKAVKAYVDGGGDLSIATKVVPTGAILPYGGATAPSNFLLCNGSAVSRTTYADLFAVTSTTYGVGNGTTTFNLPDLRSSFPLGFGQKTKAFTFVDAAVNTGTDVITVDSNQYLYTGQAVALTTSGVLPAGLSATTYYVIYVSDTTIKLANSRANADDGTAVDITAASGGGTHTLTLTLTNRALGADGGEESHTIQTEELPSNVNIASSNNTANSAAGFSPLNVNTPLGSDTPHNNMPPFVTVNYIIKT